MSAPANIHADSSIKGPLLSKYTHALGEHSAVLQFLERMPTDIEAYLRYLETIDEHEREACLPECRQYVRDLLEKGKQLADSVQEDIRLIAQGQEIQAYVRRFGKSDVSTATRVAGASERAFDSYRAELERLLPSVQPTINRLEKIQVRLEALSG
ncbi:MAG TPA: hypothetical protein VFL57_05485 [Bryobacteraceae bacterium]|nr:hypothetical protein [Bryobacteraceae bacterium]